MKFRFIKETRPFDKTIYFTERLDAQGTWSYVSDSLSFDQDEAREKFLGLVHSTNNVASITILEEIETP